MSYYITLNHIRLQIASLWRGYDSRACDAHRRLLILLIRGQGPKQNVIQGIQPARRATGWAHDKPLHVSLVLEPDQSPTYMQAHWLVAMVNLFWNKNQAETAQSLPLDLCLPPLPNYFTGQLPTDLLFVYLLTHALFTTQDAADIRHDVPHVGQKSDRHPNLIFPWTVAHAPSYSTLQYQALAGASIVLLLLPLVLLLS